MHDRRSEIRGRLRRLVDQHVRPAERRHVADLTVAAWHVPPAPDGTVGEPVPFAHAREQAYDAFTIGDAWGPAWATTWFRLTGQVPADLAHPELVVDLGFQGNMARIPGRGSRAPTRRHARQGAEPAQRLGSRDSGGVGGPLRRGRRQPARPHVVEADPDRRQADLVGRSRLPAGDAPRSWRSARRYASCSPTSRCSTSSRPSSARTTRARSRSCSPWSPRWTRSTSPTCPGTATAARGALTAALGRPAYDGAHRVSAVGHAHIDSAWLWPVRETVRKVTRTVANVVNLLDHDPDLVYAMSSAQQWEWVRTEHPALFERVQGARGGRPVRARRRHVGRVRHQHGGRRGDGPAVPGRPAVVRGAPRR